MKQLSVLYNSKNINSILIEKDSRPDPQKAIKVLERAISFLKEQEENALQEQAISNILKRANKLKW